MGIRAGKLTCPTCDRYMADVLRGTADALSELVGGYVGGRIGGPAGARIGADVAPVLIEHGAMAVAENCQEEKNSSPKEEVGRIEKASEDRQLESQEEERRFQERMESVSSDERSAPTLRP